MGPVDSVVADDANDPAIAPDRAGESASCRIFPQGLGNVLFSVRQFLGRIHPRQPLAQLGAVSVDHCKQGRRILRPDQTQFQHLD